MLKLLCVVAGYSWVGESKSARKPPSTQLNAFAVGALIEQYETIVGGFAFGY